MRSRDLRGVVALLPFLAAFGPCGLPDEELGTRSALAEEEGPRDLPEESDVIVVPRGVAVILQCRGTCGADVVVRSSDSTRVFAGATRTRERERGEVGVIVGLVEGETKITFDIFDNSYTRRVRVREPDADVGQALRVITLDD
jgi:hypothetical protein